MPLKHRLWALDVVIVGTWFFASFLVRAVPGSLAPWVPFLLVAGYLALISVTYPPARLRARLDRASLFAIVLGVVFVAVLFEPVLFVPSSLLPNSPATIASLLAYAALYGLFLQAFVFNLNIRGSLTRGRPGAVAPAFLLYLVLLVPYATLTGLATATGPQILSFVVTDLFGGAALFVALLLWFTKSNFTNLPGVLFYLLFSVPSAVTVLLATNPVLELAWLFAAFAVVFVLLETLLPTTRAERRLFPAAPHRMSRGHVGAFAGTLVLLGLVVLVLLLLLPATLGTAHPYYADATGSMAPQIEPGSLLFVKHVSLDSIQVGQVLVFTAPWALGLVVAHEVTAIFHSPSGLEFRTRGIANPSADPQLVPARNVLGIVLLVVPYLGYLVLYSYLVLLVSAVALGAYVAYSVLRPTRPRLRMPGRKLARRGLGD